MSKTITQTQENIQQVNDNIEYCMSKFGVGELLRVCNARKAKGFSGISVFTYIIYN